MGNLTLPQSILDGTLQSKAIHTNLDWINNKQWIGADAPALPFEGQQWYDTVNDILSVWNSTLNQWDGLSGSGASPTLDSLTLTKWLVVNESGGDNDSRFEGDTDVNLIFVDASTDRVGFGTNTPAYKVHIAGTLGVTGDITAGGLVDGVDVGSHTHNGAGQGGTVSHTYLSDRGTNTHATIDSHIASTANPHSVTKAQVGLTNVTDDAQLKRSAWDFASFANKAVPVGGDLLLIEDSGAVGVKKYCTITQALSAGITVVNLTADSSIASTKKWLFDGAGGHTYIYESANDVLDVYVGGNNYMKITVATTTIDFNACHVTVDAQSKIYLDGGGDTYIFESGANVFDLYVGNANTIKSSATLVTVPVALTVTGITIHSDDVKVAQSKKVILDTDLHTYIWSNGADALEMYVGTVKTISSSATVVTHAVITSCLGDIQLTATKKLILDTSAGHSYIVESGDGVVDLYAGAVKTISSSSTVVTVPVALTVTGVTIHSDDVKVAQSKKIYMDTDLHSYIWCNGADTIELFTAGAKAVTIDSTQDVTHSDFTALGTGNAKIKIKTYTGTSANAEGARVNVVHGFATATKIIHIGCLLNYGGTSCMPPNFTWYSGYQYEIFLSTDDIWVCNHATSSENILSKPFTLFVVYVE